MPPFPADLEQRIEHLGLSSETMGRILPQVDAEGDRPAGGRGVAILWHALDGGYVSARRVAHHLGTTLDDLNAAFIDAGRRQPFDL